LASQPTRGGMAVQGLGQRIRAARKAAGLTQQALAGSDFTVGLISQLENGLVRPSLRTLEVLARRLGLPPSYFLDEPAPGPDGADLDLAERLLEAGRIEEAAGVLAPLAGGAAGALTPRARRLLGVWRLRSGSPGEALAHLEAALAAAGEGDPAEKARIHQAIAGALDRLGRWEEATGHLAEALALLHASAGADPVLRLKVGTSLALLYGRLGRDAECLELGERVLRWARETGLTFRLGDLLQALAAARRRRGDSQGALQFYRVARLLYDLLEEDRHRAGARGAQDVTRTQSVPDPEVARRQPARREVPSECRRIPPETRMEGLSGAGMDADAPGQRPGCRGTGGHRGGPEPLAEPAAALGGPLGGSCVRCGGSAVGHPLPGHAALEATPQG